MPGEEDQIGDETLIENEDEVGFEEDLQDDGETVIAFSDDEQEEEPELVKKLRDEIRERDRKLAQLRRAPTAINTDDPEPQVSAEPGSIAEFDYDEDRQRAAWKQHTADLAAHAEWEKREDRRKSDLQRAQTDRAKRAEQQRSALGINDFDARSDRVHEMLSANQIAILLDGADDAPRLIAALGAPGAHARLALLAGEENLAKFAVTLGKMEKEIKVTKRTAPPPESRVVGATAQLSTQADKHLERLEREAEKSGDRSKVIAYRREQRAKQAA